MEIDPPNRPIYKRNNTLKRRLEESRQVRKVIPRSGIELRYYRNTTTHLLSSFSDFDTLVVDDDDHDNIVEESGAGVRTGWTRNPYVGTNESKQAIQVVIRSRLHALTRQSYYRKDSQHLPVIVKHVSNLIIFPYANCTTREEYETKLLNTLKTIFESFKVSESEENVEALDQLSELLAHPMYDNGPNIRSPFTGLVCPSGAFEVTWLWFLRVLDMCEEPNKDMFRTASGVIHNATSANKETRVLKAIRDKYYRGDTFQTHVREKIFGAVWLFGPYLTMPIMDDQESNAVSTQLTHQAFTNASVDILHEMLENQLESALPHIYPLGRREYDINDFNKVYWKDGNFNLARAWKDACVAWKQQYDRVDIMDGIVYNSDGTQVTTELVKPPDSYRPWLVRTIRFAIKVRAVVGAALGIVNIVSNINIILRKSFSMVATFFFPEASYHYEFDRDAFTVGASIRRIGGIEDIDFIDAFCIILSSLRPLEPEFVST